MKCITKMANEYLKNKRTKPMTAEQLEDLLSDLTHGSKLRRDSAHDDLSALAPSLARRVLAADKLVEAIYDDASDQWWTNVNNAATAYREASK